MAFQNSPTAEFSWMDHKITYDMDPNIFIDEPEKPSDTIEEAIDKALEKAGVFCVGYNAAAVLYLQAIARRVPVSKFNPELALSRDEFTLEKMTALRETSRTPVTHVLLPKSNANRFKADDRIILIATSILDEAPYNGNEIVALAIPEKRKVFYIEGEYARLKPQWHKHVARLKYPV